jgi:maltooligosyltrehalose trehalohydrolase
MLFQGEEFAASAPFFYFTDHQDPQLGEAVSKGRLQEFTGFGWSPDDLADPQDEGTFLRSKIDWDEVKQADHAEILDWYKKLIALRRSNPALIDGDVRSAEACFDEEAKWLMLTRGSFDILCNFSNTEIEIPLAKVGQLVLASDANSVVQDKSAKVSPESVLILQRR